MEFGKIFVRQIQRLEKKSANWKMQDLATGNPRNRYSDGRSKKRVTIAKRNDYGGKVI